MAKSTLSPFERLISHVAFVPGPLDTECWLWQLKVEKRGGYVRMTVNGRGLMAHRFAYEQVLGPIPTGLHLDHLCRIRHCLNPLHCEPVTQKENNARSMSPGAIATRTGRCLRGHSLDDAYVRDGRRLCRTCALGRTHGRKWPPLR